MPGKSPAQCAATEAYEEAGADGKIHDHCLGLFSYTKEMPKGQDNLPCVALVYPLKVKKLLSAYPEKSDRKRKWFTLKKASERVSEPELSVILRAFDPRKLR